MLTAPTTLGFSKPLMQGEVLLEVCWVKESVRPEATGAVTRCRQSQRRSRVRRSERHQIPVAETMLTTDVDGRPGLVLQGQMSGRPGDEVDLSVWTCWCSGETKVSAFDRTGNMVVEEQVPASRPSLDELDVGHAPGCGHHPGHDRVERTYRVVLVLLGRR